MQARKLLVWAAAILMMPFAVFGDAYAELKFTIPATPPAYTGKTNLDLKKMQEIPYYSFHDDPTADPIAAYASEIEFQYDLIGPHKDAWTSAKKTDPKAPRSYLSKAELAAYLASWNRVAKYLAVARSEWENLPRDNSSDYSKLLKIVVEKFVYQTISGAVLIDGTTFKDKDVKDVDWGTDLIRPIGFYGYAQPTIFDSDADNSMAIAQNRLRRMVAFYGYLPVSASLLLPEVRQTPAKELLNDSNPERIDPYTFAFLINKLAEDLDAVLTREQKLAIRDQLLQSIFIGMGFQDGMGSKVLPYTQNGKTSYRAFLKNSWWPAKDAIDPKSNPNAQDKD